METSKNFNTFDQPEKLPNATPTLILGVLSIILCWCYGIFSLILGAVGLLISKKDLAAYRENPAKFTNYNNLNVGRILCIIGLVLGLLTLAYFVWLISYFGIENLQNPAAIQEKLRELQGR
jgi:hypothetical protein